MSFDVGNNLANYLSTTDASGIAAYPFAVGVWFRRNSTGSVQMLWSSQLDSDHYVTMSCEADDFLHFLIKDGTGTETDLVDTNSISSDTWTYAIFLALSSTDRRILYSGLDFGTPETTMRDISGYTDSRIGNGNGETCDGQIGEVTVWKGFTGNPFSDFNMGFDLGFFGYSPLFFPNLIQYITSYQRLWNDSTTVIGPAWTENGSVVFDPIQAPRTLHPGGMMIADKSAPEGNHLTGEAADTIALTESHIIPILVQDTISLEESIFNSKFQYITDTISLSEHIFLLPKGKDHVSMTETIVTTTSREREYDDDIELFETIQAFVNADCPTCCDPDEQYHPYVGTSSDPDLPTPPSSTPPTLTPSHSIVLSYPYVTPTLTVTLRAPEFDNKDTVENKRVRRASRGGTIQIFADPQWPKIYQLHMDFAALSEQVAQDYAAFRQQTLGKEIKLVDHESRVWKGVLIEVATPITRNRRHGVTASLVFEGELQ